MTSALDRLRADEAVTELTPSNLDLFFEHPAPSLVVFLGDTARRPEAHDIAVVTRDILRSHRGELRGFVVELEHDAAVREKLVVGKVPAVGFARRGRVEEILGGIRDWTQYQAALHRLLENEVTA